MTDPDKISRSAAAADFRQNAAHFMALMDKDPTRRLTYAALSGAFSAAAAIIEGMKDQ